MRRTLLTVVLWGLVGALPAAAAGVPPQLAVKLDPRLLDAALHGAPATPVWVGFRDKGEQGPAELAAMLARAEAALTPEARARRDRAHVWPRVDYRDLPLHQAYLDSLGARGLAPYGASRWFNQVAVRADGAALAGLAALPFVERLAPVERARPSRDFPSGADMPAPGPAREAARAGAAAINYGLTQAQLQQMNVPAVHDSGYTGLGVMVCILDAGFNYYRKHEALRGVNVGGGVKGPRTRDFVRGITSVQDTVDNPGYYQHGTMVMGCIAGNKPGTYVGSAYQAAYALARTENDSTETPVEMVYWGMGAEWADSLGADLITSSLGYFQFDQGVGDYTYADMNGHTTIVTRAAEIAASKGILVVNAMGNEGQNPWHYLIAPADANGDSVIAVGAVNSTGTVAGFSSYGPSADGRVKPDLAARGVGNPLVAPWGDPQAYTSGSGTSFATPLVAGLAACLLQARPTWTPSMVIRALRETASQAAGPDYRVGYGIPDGLAALRWTPGTTGVPAVLTGRFGLWLEGPNPLRADGPAALVHFALDDEAAGPVVERLRAADPEGRLAHTLWSGTHALGQAGSASLPARLRVLDVQGRLVRALWSGALVRGQAVTVPWDGRGGGGAPVDPGIYFIALEAGGHVAALRVVALR